MPHQCVRCNKFYDDGSAEILKGCSCGARLFFFIKQEKLNAIKQGQEAIVNLPREQKVQMEQDVIELLGPDENTAPVVLDLESVRVVSPGKYELDLVQLFKGEPLIFKLADGKYMIDVPGTFQKMKKK